MTVKLSQDVRYAIGDNVPKARIAMTSETTHLPQGKHQDRRRAAKVGLDLARSIARFIQTMPGVVGVAVFGSVARGSASAESDIDLLVLVDDSGPTRSHILSSLPAKFRRNRLGIQVFQRKDLARLMGLGTSFTSHLRREALALTDTTGELDAIIHRNPVRTVPTESELEAQLGQLASYRNLDVFRDNYLHVLSRLYRLGKAIIMLGLYSEGRPIFDRRQAFAEFKRRHPEAASAVDSVERLQPFYLLVSRRQEDDLPFSYHGNRGEVVKSVKAVEDVARAVR